ncbi:MAG TPA: folylpolyglutamate synthase/dihydrofolate synthase family protein [Stellaceae bacterium]|nr:folylpolyglutamate synthase/dihydrofolate synthase family protein [Stellaceae bacterium]
MARSDAILERLTRLHPRSIDLSLDRIRHLMRILGDPQEQLASVIHVAGTNGKGSTVATLRALFEAAGYRVHAYTSPHLVRFAERIRLAGRLIEEDALVELLEEIERRNDGTPITFFEITTAAAFLAFARTAADVVLLETGLGGRLDATNLVTWPAATIITPVAMDHMNWFGDDLRMIAREKAGILKPGSPAVIGRQEPAALAVLEARARELDAPLHRFGVEWTAAPAGEGWRYEGPRWRFDLPPSRLPGRYQIDNAGGAVAALEVLEGFAFTRETLAAGLAAVEWPARMQRLTRGPLVDRLGPVHELWLDGAHNAHAGAMLAEQAAEWCDRPLHLVFGGLTTRDPRDVLRDVAPFAAGLRGVAIPGEANAHPAEAIAAAAGDLGIPAAPAASVAEAIAAIADGAGGPVRVLICGSLYLAGHVLAENG